MDVNISMINGLCFISSVLQEIVTRVGPPYLMPQDGSSSSISGKGKDDTGYLQTRNTIFWSRTKLDSLWEDHQVVENIPLYCCFQHISWSHFLTFYGKDHHNCHLFCFKLCVRVAPAASEVADLSHGGIIVVIVQHHCPVLWTQRRNHSPPPWMAKKFWGQIWKNVLFWVLSDLLVQAWQAPLFSFWTSDLDPAPEWLQHDKRIRHKLNYRLGCVSTG